MGTRQQLLAQAPDPAQVERLKQMAERMKGMTPQQMMKQQDSIMKMVKQMQGIRDSIKTDVLTQTSKKVANGDQLLIKHHFDTGYAKVTFLYTYTSSTHSTKASSNLYFSCGGSNNKAPKIYEANGHFIVNTSSASQNADTRLIDTMMKNISKDNPYMDAATIQKNTDIARQVSFSTMAINDHGLKPSVQYAANGHAECGSTTTDIRGLPTIEGFTFEFDPVANLSTIGLGANFKVLNISKGWCPTISNNSEEYITGMGFKASTDITKAKMAGQEQITNTDPDPVYLNVSKTSGGISISYQRSKTFIDNGGENNIKETLTAFISDVDRYEAFIEPADTSEYNKWIPKGPVLTNYPMLPNKGKGNDIQLKVTLWDVIANKPAVDLYKAVIKLNNVSNMPGYCMNFPEDDKDADDKSDMRFDRQDSSIYESWSQNSITTKSNSGPQYATVVSYDYGGIADVTADITTKNGLTLKAHVRNRVKDTLTLPKRTNGSFIADYWKLQQHATDKTDMADDEEIEVRDDRYPGDGLTLYEEYRGFLENRKHFRGNAEKKDMMVCNKIATARSQDGINNCEAVLNQYGNHVIIHSKFKADEFGKKHDPEADELQKMADRSITTPMKYDRCLNYNYIENLHLVDQHGVVLMNSDASLGYAEAVMRGSKIGPPKNMYFLVITKDFNPGPNGWSETYGSADNNGKIGTGEGGVKIITDEYARTVSHEMLHCFHVLHHGDKGDFGNYEFFYSELGNSWQITYINKIPRVDQYGARLNINLFWEDDPNHQIDPTDKAVNKRAWPIYGNNSTHSGVEDCIMRYDVSYGYFQGPNIYLIRSKGDYKELSGINLCNSTIGTGVNSRNHKPVSRYGDAAPGRGNCIHQFCVSDKYD